MLYDRHDLQGQMDNLLESMFGLGSFNVDEPTTKQAVITVLMSRAERLK